MEILNWQTQLPAHGERSLPFTRLREILQPLQITGYQGLFFGARPTFDLSLPATDCNKRREFLGIDQCDGRIDGGGAAAFSSRMFLASGIKVFCCADIEIAGPESKCVKPCCHGRALRCAHSVRLLRAFRLVALHLRPVGDLERKRGTIT